MILTNLLANIFAIYAQMYPYFVEKHAKNLTKF